MCGFLGEFCFESFKITDENTFADLLALSISRGPDATKITSHENYQLGFNRLSILDLSPNGNQPKESPKGRYHIVFNGEIYNYKALITVHKLQNLNSTSDTEVIIHLLDKLGIEKTIPLLNGMFAMAIVDRETNTFFLTRDFAGIKPLFYGVNNKGIVAASQFDQIYKHPWFKENLELRPETVKEYFGFGFMQAPNTIYNSIFQVKPGEIIKVNCKGHIEKRDLKVFDKLQQENTINNASTLNHILENAVNRQLASDVPVATFLSGGIDSPLISAYAKKTKDDIEGFTIRVDDVKLNESDIAKEYADYLGIKQHIVSVKKEEMVTSIDAHFKAFPEPFGDFSSIPTFIITKEAKKRFTVMLSGDGGDELFFGYPRMRDILNKRLWFKFPYVIRKALAKVTNRLRITNTWAPYFKNFKAFVINKHCYLPMTLLDKAAPDTYFSEDISTLYDFDNNSRTKLLHQLRWNEFYSHMQRVLIKVDRSSMAHSLEVRVPLLDKEVIEYAWCLSSKLKEDIDLKKELKLALSNEVPKAIINKKKMGFSVPLNDWLHNDLKKDVMKHVFDIPFYGESVINSDVLKQYVNDFFNKKHHNFWGVWHIYAWQKWAVIHVLED